MMRKLKMVTDEYYNETKVDCKLVGTCLRVRSRLSAVDGFYAKWEPDPRTSTLR